MLVKLQELVIYANSILQSVGHNELKALMRINTDEQTMIELLAIRISIESKLETVDRLTTYIVDAMDHHNNKKGE